jgi:hypothetical protein
MRTSHNNPILDRSLVGLAARLVLIVSGLSSLAGAEESKWVESIDMGDGARKPGRIVATREGDYAFKPDDGSAEIALEEPRVVEFESRRSKSDSGQGSPPFRVLFGLDQQVSGRLISLDSDRIAFDFGGGAGSLSIRRRGAQALVQRPGEIEIFQDSFESLVETRLRIAGDVKLTDRRHVGGMKALKFEGSSASIAFKPVEPIGSGRFEISYYDDNHKLPNRRRFVELIFRGGEGGNQAIRVNSGWGDSTLGVESPDGPGLAVQRLVRSEGWHRLIVRFGPDRTDVSVDGDELAYGSGPAGALVEIGVSTRSTGAADEGGKDGFEALFDDLRLVRFVEPTGVLECDPARDEVRLVDGDQLFGSITSADQTSVLTSILGRDIKIPWAEISGLYFRRDPSAGSIVEGRSARVEWRNSASDDSRDLDQLEGAIIGLSDHEIKLATPYAGTVSIARDRVRRIRFLNRCKRIVLDPYPRHLGNEVFADLFPPRPEGPAFETTVDIPADTTWRNASIAIDAVQVVGISGTPTFSEKVRKGELRTNVKLDGKVIDYLNRHVTTKNDSPIRIRAPITDGLLTPGRHTIRLEQLPDGDSPSEYDDLGILGVAIEADAAGAADSNGARRP